MKGYLHRIVGILVVIGLGLYSYVMQNNPTRLPIILALASVLITFLLFLDAMGAMERRINESFDRRIPATEHLENRRDVERETDKLVEAAKEFIIATGGRSRNRSYLKEIANKVEPGDVSYWRFIYDEPITHDMCQHICSLLGRPNVFIQQITDREYGNILVVDAGFIIVLPVPGHGGLMAIKVPNVGTAQRMFRYAMTLNQDAETIKTVDAVRELCEECTASKKLSS